MSAKIISTGSYLPKLKVTNDDLAKHMDTNDEWIRQRTGIKSRYYEDDSSFKMALASAKDALKDLDQESIDCILVGTYTPDNLIPNVASAVKMGLGIKRDIPCFDINAACSGFIFTLHTARAFLKANIYKRILVVGVDFNSRVLNFEDRSTAILFGDGAGSAVLEKDETNLFDSIIHSVDDTDASLSLISNSDFSNPFVDKASRYPYFEMEGKEVFKFAVSSFRKGIQEILKQNNLSMDDIDYVISHQANKRIIETSAKLLKTDISKFLMNIEEVGNTSSGSVPLLLDQSNKAKILKKGMKVIMIAFGGGLSYGTSLIEWT